MRPVYATKRVLLESRQARSFDVICAGEPLWKLASPGGAVSRRWGAVHLRPGGGAANVALSLARQGLRVGLASVMPDDADGRACREQAAAAGVDVGGVTFARPRTGLLVVEPDGETNIGPWASNDEPALQVPDGWSSRLLLLSGLSPVVPLAAGLCKAARAARREGTLVLLDFNASFHVWAGRDPRMVRMVLREVDAARCSVADLAVVGMDVGDVRSALRPGAVLVFGDGTSGAVATGPFGEVSYTPSRAATLTRAGAGDAFTAALCAQLIRKGRPGESAGARWHRALRYGHEAAFART